MQYIYLNLIHLFSRWWLYFYRWWFPKCASWRHNLRTRPRNQVQPLNFGNIIIFIFIYILSCNFVDSYGGVSIGSLGAKNSEGYVSGVTVNGAQISGTTNGVRIKTWQVIIRHENTYFLCVYIYIYKIPIELLCLHSWLIFIMFICLKISIEQGGSGTASNIKFQNIYMFNVSNPIIIDQNYCDQEEPCKEQVQISMILNNYKLVILYQ